MQWIDITKESPTDNENSIVVWIGYPINDWTKASVMDDGEIISDTEFGRGYMSNVTHWCRIIEPKPA